MISSHVAALAFAMLAVNCSSSDATLASSVANDGGTSSSSSSSGGSESGPTIADVTPDQATKIVFLGALPSGNLIATEGSQHRVIELEPTGKVVKVNDTDFAGTNTPAHVAVDDEGRVFIGGYQTIILYATGDIRSSKTVFVAPNGNDSISNIAWGGSPKRLWAMKATNPTAPKTQIIRFDAATVTAGGTPTVVGEIDTTAIESMVVDSANNAYMIDFNACRILKMGRAGVVKVIAGKPLGQAGSCVMGSYGKNEEQGAFFGQGSALGFDPTGQKLLFSDRRNHVLLDVTEDTDGVSRAALVAEFPEDVDNGSFVSSMGAIFVVDDKTHTLKKVSF